MLWLFHWILNWHHRINAVHRKYHSAIVTSKKWALLLAFESNGCECSIPEEQWQTFPAWEHWAFGNVHWAVKHVPQSNRKCEHDTKIGYGWKRHQMFHLPDFTECDTRNDRDSNIISNVPVHRQLIIDHWTKWSRDEQNIDTTHRNAQNRHPVITSRSEKVCETKNNQLICLQYILRNKNTRILYTVNAQKS